jgi:ribosomal subunit interface protein
MRISIHGLGLPLTAALLDHTDRKLRSALTRTSDQIKRVVIHLGETNVSSGGKDKFCRMHLHLEHALHVFFEDTGADMYAVIDRVAERARRNVAKCTGRLHRNVRLAKGTPLLLLRRNAFGMS